jgi:hypothetical protein
MGKKGETISRRLSYPPQKRWFTRSIIPAESGIAVSG